MILQQWMLQQWHETNRCSEYGFEVLARKNCITRKRGDFGRNIVQRARKRAEAAITSHLPSNIVMTFGICRTTRYRIEHASYPKFLSGVRKEPLQCSATSFVQSDMQKHAPLPR